MDVQLEKDNSRKVMKSSFVIVLLHGLHHQNIDQILKDASLSCTDGPFFVLHIIA